ncbi:ectoine/hydroxyectoine ABC transporter permease subunit EhuD [Limnochorda pilosa]|uniref:ectoine/hydroxyectoine ABC transporter permease subunit EhuD n=1 Tax=Limnochorda pilosa TaxID=1555112 RepID=UPI0026F02BB5|nr:ectoine/hydroxyectoine ABC transporter permease subunit EhuD [Limnochorda pilosa]
MTFDWAYAKAILPSLLEAMVITLQATFAGFGLAVVVGLGLALARRSAQRVISRPAGWFVEFVRSTPLLVQLYFLFFALPSAGISLSPFAAGVLGLGLHYATYISEVYRAGIEAVPPGQWEAATALNFNRFQTWTRVILPQAIPPIIPMLGNYLIVMFKETPQLSAITVVEMLQRAKILGARSFQYLEPFTLVGLLFLLLSYPSSLLVRRLEARLARRG